MIISLSKKFIFVHNPKTAGSSIQQALLSWDDGKHLKKKTKHETLLEFQNRTNLDISDFFIFGFVRNPWDRFSSFFHFLRKQPEKFPQIVDISNINEFASRIDEDWLKNCYSIKSQNEYFDKRVFIGRYENLDADFNYIIDQIGISVDLIHVNKSVNHRYRDLYNKKGKNILANRYKKDIEMYGYNFEIVK